MKAQPNEEEEELVIPIRAEYVEQHDPCMGERKLLIAILERWIRDVLGIKGVRPAEFELSCRRDAREWAALEDTFKESPEPTPFSFQWVCEGLGINALQLHNRVSYIMRRQPTAINLKAQLKNRTFRRTPRPCKMKSIS